MDEYDSDINLYCLGARWYSPRFHRFISPDDVSYLGANGDLNSYNLYAYCSNNPVMYVDPTGHSIIGVLIGLAVSSLLAWGASEIFGSQIVGGASSVANGAGAIYTGIGLLSFGPVGWVSGGALILIGAFTFAFGANEVVDGISGVNYIQKWTGMSDGWYNGLYIGLNAASGVGSLAGNIGMSFASNRIINSIVKKPSKITNYNLRQIKTFGRYTSLYKTGTLQKGSHVGQGYTLTYKTNASLGYIQWHPGSKYHFGGSPYWKVTSSRGGTWRGQYLF